VSFFRNSSLSFFRSGERHEKGSHNNAGQLPHNPPPLGLASGVVLTPVDRPPTGATSSSADGGPHKIDQTVGTAARSHHLGLTRTEASRSSHHSNPPHRVATQTHIVKAQPQKPRGRDKTVSPQYNSSPNIVTNFSEE
jgi:hypothetical protein